jgi:GrpB-like predicted nucleotidyltransferase (UPF0157 family)
MNEVTLVVPHNPEWAALFLAESDRIQHVFGGAAVVIHHIGSTAIPNTWAKPIIDILVVADDLAAIDQKQSGMAALGYEPKGEFGIEGRRYFRKEDGAGRRTHHVHVFEQGSEHIERHLVFRDFLRSHPDWAEKYSDLKRTLAENRVANYTDEKTEFVRHIEQMARQWRKGT